MNKKNMWEEFIKLPTIKKVLHAHANKIVAMEFRRTNILKKIAKLNEEFSQCKVSTAVLKFVEKQTHNLPGSKELSKTIEQQIITINIMDLKNKNESLGLQIKEEEQDFAGTIKKLIAATQGYDTEEMLKSISDLEDILLKICDKIRTCFAMTIITADKEKQLKAKRREKRLSKTVTDKSNQSFPKKSVAPKGNPKEQKTQQNAAKNQN
ncbi:hypothetical protein BB561_006580 [Smittium simulii]|uniref:Uncharacterized protein n=1 Tax=Smittium simulii TaxID=133385 RepID=A0A2T9Y347_9FUNG|nr:hypothetical protein BB561_006580 [Smittium simulii]